MWQHRFRDADASVGDAHDRFVRHTPHRDLDMSAAIRVVHGVVQQIAEDLREPYWIRVDQHRRVWQGDAKQNPGRVDLFPVEVYRAIDDNREVKPLLSQLDLAVADTRDLEQIVDEPHEMLDLPLHHLLRALGGRPLSASYAQHLQAVANGRERIAQLVG